MTSATNPHARRLVLPVLDARPDAATPPSASGHLSPAGAFGTHLYAPALLGREARCVAQPFRPGFFIQER
jgi:hypothetical protein